MDIETEQQNDILIGCVKGDVDINSSPQFKKKLQELSNKKNQKILIDFKGMNYIDSSGLATVVDFFKAIKANGAQLIFCGLSENVKKLFVITRLDKLFKIVDSRAEAMEMF